MSPFEDYVERIDGACGEGTNLVVTLKPGKKDQAMAKILRKAQLTKSFSGIVYQLCFKEVSFRLYSSGRLIFRDVGSKEEIRNVLTILLL